MQKQGYDVSAICSEGKWIKDIGQSGIKVKTIRFKRRSFSPRADIVAFFQLFLYFKKEKFDIVHTHTPKPEIYGQLAAKLAGVPIIMDTLHGFDLSPDTRWTQRKFFTFLQRFTAKYSDVIFSVSKDVVRKAIEERKRIVAGEVNEVYDVQTEDGNLIVRISREEENRFIPEKWAIEKSGEAGVPVPEVLLVDEAEDKAFLFIDPPYFNADQDKFYTHSFKEDDHHRLCNVLKRNSDRLKFLLTYDNSPEIRDLYKWVSELHEKEWNYTLNRTDDQKNGTKRKGVRYKGRELFIINYDSIKQKPLFLFSTVNRSQSL